MANKINILVASMYPGIFGGIDRCIMNYVINMNPDKFQFDFICYSYHNEQPGCRKEIIDNGGRIFIVPGRKKNISNYKMLNKICKNNYYDIVWVNLGDLFNIRLLKIARKHNIRKRIVHGHSIGSEAGIISRLVHQINKILLPKYATDFWACSKIAGEYFFTKKIRCSSSFKIIHNAIDAKKFNFKNDIRNMKRKELNVDGNFVIGHVGRFSPVKNHQFLVKIFYEIYKKCPDSILLLIGEGELRTDIERLVKSLALEKNIYFLGHRMDMPELFHAMDVFVFPSYFEGLGLAVVEAQAASLQCFVSKTVPTEVKIVRDSVSFIDINETAEKWADEILQKKYYQRISTLEEMKNQEYDIKTESKKMELYLS
ncbi:capsular polysaccharide biosynthesis protein [Treponema primitia ZAS-2]|uniref:Capsular polysaccharide biosynthesis protein n=1 Tax=Treponema primitia (strain ATCC BAA-887 / DSM 12427 / ZAS-2) TaxID=545694 RepID=F5YNZ2_TREPZ|nr:glycosyltransferase family 1 protein [Treponema primitia]AEF84492.1 capsular polysaccharide biosynthesis protein [Treponema primitia ZAS-2]